MPRRQRIKDRNRSFLPIDIYTLIEEELDSVFISSSNSLHKVLMVERCHVQSLADKIPDGSKTAAEKHCSHCLVATILVIFPYILDSPTPGKKEINRMVVTIDRRIQWLFCASWLFPNQINLVG